jgi:hypothetical protein
MGNRIAIAAISAALLLGCQEPPGPSGDAESVPDALAASFDPASTGSIAGCVVWEGDIPEVPPFMVYANRSYAIANQFVGEKPNPHAPQVDPLGRGVRRAVVYLNNVDKAKSRPWDHPSPRVVIRAREFQVLPGEERSIVGFVRCGSKLEFINEDLTYHLVKGRGASFFSLPLVLTDRPTARRLDRAGIVELSAGAGQFWMQAYLFVDEHPYYTLSDDTGGFELKQVPPGDYELVAWMPNWHIARLERDPEVGLVSRMIYKPPMTQTRRVTVERGQSSQTDFVWSTSHFEKQ